MSGFLFEGIAKRRFERMSRKIGHWRAARAVRILSVAHPLPMLQRDPADRRRSSVCADVSAIPIRNIKIWFRVWCLSVEAGGMDSVFRISNLAAEGGRAAHAARRVAAVHRQGRGLRPDLKANPRALHKDAKEWLEDL